MIHSTATSPATGSAKILQIVLPMAYKANSYLTRLANHRQGKVKVKVIPRHDEVSQGVPGRLRPRIFLTFGTTRVVGRQPHAPAAFTPGEIPGTHFQSLSRPQGTGLCRWEPRKKSPVTSPGIDPGTVRLVAQCLNHYANPDPNHRQVDMCNV